jgi:uncharacterized cofD-like protein
VAAIAAADVVVLGPGSLYTSVVPNLLVAGVADAIRRTRAVRVFACNLTTQPGETDGFDAAGHVRALEEVLGAGAIDLCLVNSRPLPAAAAAAGAVPVRWTPPRTALRGAFPVLADLLPAGGFAGRHDPDKLAAAVLALARVRPSVRRPAPGRAWARPGAAAAAPTEAA